MVLVLRPEEREKWAEMSAERRYELFDHACELSDFTEADVSLTDVLTARAFGL